MGSRISANRPPGLPFSSDIPSPARPGGWGIVETVQRHCWTRQVTVDPARLMAGLVTSEELSGSAQRGSGYSHQYAARLNASRQLRAMALLFAAVY